MVCKNCNSEIDDKALVCFRCGYATSERKVEPVVLTEDRDQSSRRQTWVPLVLAIVFIAVSGFFMTELAGGVPPDPMVWLMLAMAGGLLAWRVRLR